MASSGLGQFMWLGKDEAIRVDHDFGVVALPDRFYEELFLAVKRVLKMSLDFSRSPCCVKHDLVNGDLLFMKTCGIPWCYRFVSNGRSKLLFLGDDDKFKSASVIPQTLVIRYAPPTK